MINFMCQSGWTRGCPDETLFLGMYVKGWFESVDSVKKLALHNMCGRHPIHEGPGLNKKECVPFLPAYLSRDLRVLTSRDLYHQLVYTRSPSLQNQIRLILLAFEVSTPACKWQILGLLGLCNHVSQSPYSFEDWGVQHQGTRSRVWWMPASSLTAIFSPWIHMAERLGSSLEPLL